jgi:FKBP-type peptidyl-prolyl cis-trans isomerase SlyD
VAILNITKNSVVTLDYTLTDDKNQTLDSSSGGEPLVYLHGANNIIPGLEEALEGKKQGDKFKVTVPADKAYGERMQEMVQSVPKDQFPQQDIQVGMRFQAHTPNGAVVLTVIEVKDKEVVVDGNHPLAGQNLHFDLEVKEVREASDEEKAHGHVHGAGGHHH